jgi:hypothetical protein
MNAIHIFKDANGATLSANNYLLPSSLPAGFTWAGSTYFTQQAGAQVAFTVPPTGKCSIVVTDNSGDPFRPLLLHRRINGYISHHKHHADFGQLLFRQGGRTRSWEFYRAGETFYIKGLIDSPGLVEDPGSTYAPTTEEGEE